MFLAGALPSHLTTPPPRFQTQRPTIILSCTGTLLEVIQIRLSLTPQMADSNATRTPSACNTTHTIQRSPSPGLFHPRTSGAATQSRPMTTQLGNSATQELHGILLIHGQQPITWPVLTGRARTPIWYR